MRSSPLAKAAQTGQELAAEHPAEHADRQEEIRPRADPAGSIRRQPSTGHDAVDVRVELQGLSPGVQHSDQAGVGAKVVGIGGHLEHGCSGGAEQQAIDDPGIGQGDRAQDIRQREDEMEVRHGEQLCSAGFRPPCRGRGLTGGAVAVAAGVVGDLLMPALGALQDMTAQGRGSAGGQVFQGAALLGRESPVVLAQKLVIGAADDLGHREPRSVHDRRSPRFLRSRRSSGLALTPWRQWPRGRSEPWC